MNALLLAALTPISGPTVSHQLNILNSGTTSRESVDVYVKSALSGRIIGKATTFHRLLTENGFQCDLHQLVTALYDALDVRFNQIRAWEFEAPA